MCAKSMQPFAIKRKLKRSNPWCISWQLHPSHMIYPVDGRRYLTTPSSSHFIVIIIVVLAAIFAAGLIGSYGRNRCKAFENFNNGGGITLQGGYN